MRRRDLLKSAAVLPALTCLNFASAATGDDPISFPQLPRERLNQGPFDIEQDEGWQTILFTTPSEKPLRNPGFGLVGYSWEESGPSLAARAGRETLEQPPSAFLPCRSSTSSISAAIGATCRSVPVVSTSILSGR